ncbi:G1/S-specific cyclin-D3 [Leptinotarsa decemlineata]|uniref:G1/S-specific cyclin-D3 n=1 Tax=Leptinotarsa decemlineata TaxID=7539 RepID=UPI000C25439D|nr:G1/S-specific cyclin-D3-like [Leptinotarsa decemlineata]
MDLYCCEIAENENTAYDDPTLLQDRVLRVLLKTEDRYVLPYSATLSKQKEVTVEMRKIVAEWMMEVCEEQKCQDEVFSLAMNYMDRFLMCCSIMKNQLQLLGTACMLIASKLRESRPLAGETLVYYTDHSVTKQQLSSWELLVLSKLKWDIASVTPHDFLRHLLNRLPMEDNWMIRPEMVLNHAKTLITLCAREFTFSRYHPSIIACASITSALCGVGWVGKSGRTLQDLLQRLTEITNIEKDYVEECFNQIDKMIRDSTCDQATQSSEVNPCDNIRPGEFTPPPGKNQEHEAALTPTDVHDVHF